MKKGTWVVVNVNRNKISLCGGNMAGMAEVQLPAEAVADLGIVNQEKLEQVVGEFVKSANVGASDLVVVLGPDVCFEKDIERKADVQIQTETQKFLELVPVVSAGSKVFETDKLYRIVAISREFYEGLRTAFEKSGLAVRVVVPSFVLGAVGVGETFNEQACRLLLTHLEQVAGYGFDLEEKKELTFAVAKDKFLNTHKTLITVMTAASLVMLAIVAYVVTRKPGA